MRPTYTALPCFRNAILFCILFAFLFGVSGKSARAGERYTFDKDETSIFFSVSRLGIFEEKGEFQKFDGNFVFSLRHPDKDAITLTLYSSGIHTDDEDTEKDLRGPDFFNAEQFPEVHFVSTAINLVDKDNATITGNLTLLGITKPITLDAHFTEKANSPASDDVVSFSASGIINRSDFGMDHLIPIIGDEVHLDIQVQGIRQKH